MRRQRSVGPRSGEELSDKDDGENESSLAGNQDVPTELAMEAS